MVTRVVAGVVLLALGVAAGADEPMKAEDVKKAVVGKWETDDKDKVPLEINADGTIKVPFLQQGGKWTLVDVTYTIKDDGEIRYRAQTGGVTLGGWYRYKDGTLTSAMGPKLRVTWKKVPEAKKPDDRN
jgi:uncharacterized protein (TIGR03066 family)